MGSLYLFYFIIRGSRGSLGSEELPLAPPMTAILLVYAKVTKCFLSHYVTASGGPETCLRGFAPRHQWVGLPFFRLPNEPSLLKAYIRPLL